MQKDVEGPGDRERLEEVAADRDSTDKHLCRTRIILAADEDRGTAEAMARSGWLGPTVALAAPIHEAGVDGLLREETRRSGKVSIPTRSSRG
jgi:hypothetical protein